MKKILIGLSLLLSTSFAQRDPFPGLTTAGTNGNYNIETYALKDSSFYSSGPRLSTSAFLFGEMEMARINPKRSNPALDSLLNYASGVLGTRYRSGGEGPGGFDCSGFVNYVFSNFGVSLPRNSGSIAIVGLPVNSVTAKKGDLIFFSGRGGGGRVGHVGIVTGIRDGVIHFIHSASSKGVSYASTAEGYYRARVLGIRRIIKS